MTTKKYKYKNFIVSILSHDNNTKFCASTFPYMEDDFYNIYDTSLKAEISINKVIDDYIKNTPKEKIKWIEFVMEKLKTHPKKGNELYLKCINVSPGKMWFTKNKIYKQYTSSELPSNTPNLYLINDANLHDIVTYIKIRRDLMSLDDFKLSSKEEYDIQIQAEEKIKKDYICKGPDGGHFKANGIFKYCDNGDIRCKKSNGLIYSKKQNKFAERTPSEFTFYKFIKDDMENYPWFKKDIIYKGKPKKEDLNVATIKKPQVISINNKVYQIYESEGNLGDFKIVTREEYEEQERIHKELLEKEREKNACGPYCGKSDYQKFRAMFKL